MHFIQSSLLLVFYSVDIVLSLTVFGYSIARLLVTRVTWCCRRINRPRPTKHAVIIGYQFAGFEVHKLLQQNASLPHFTFTVIEPKSYFEFTPAVLSAMVNPTKYRSISFPFSLCFDTDRSTLIRGKVTSIHSHSVTVDTLHAGTITVPFDYCFICTGSKYAPPIKVNPSLSAPKDLEFNERCKSFDDTHSALRSLSTAGPSNRWSGLEPLRRSQSIAIIGGGPVGVELMAEIICNGPAGVEVTVLDANDRLCRRFPPSTSRYLEGWTRERDRIALRLNTRIRQIIAPPHSKDENVGSRKTVLVISQNVDGNAAEAAVERLAFDVVFRCIGFEPNSEMMQSEESDAKLKECLTEKCRFIAVDEWMRVKAQDNDCIFAIGDVVEQLMVNESKLAHTAEIHAMYVSEMVAAMENTNGGMRPYHEWLLGEGAVAADGRKWTMPLVFTISLGEVDGSMGFGHLLLNGFVSQLLKWFIERSLCTLYQRRGVFDFCNVFGGGGGGNKSRQDVWFRVYPLGYRVFTVMWWFSHQVTRCYIRYSSSIE